MNKKAIALLGGIFILIIGTLGFLIFQKRGASTPPAGTADQAVETPVTDPAPADSGGTDVPAADAGGPGLLSDDQVVSPILTYTGDGVTYLNGQGQLFRSDIQASGATILLGNKKEITIAIKSGITRVLWPPSGNNFIAETDSGSTRSFSFFDANQNVYKDLPAQMNSVAWLPDGTHILYTWFNSSTGKATLNISNGDGTGYRKISDIFDGDAEIVPSPDGKSILFYRRNNTDGVINKIVFTTPDGKVFRTLAPDGYNFGVLWAPDSRSFLFSRRDPATQKPQLWLGDLQGNTVNLGLATTVDKVLWSKDGASIIAAEPTTGIAGQGLTEDTLFRLTLSSQDKKEFPLGSGVDVRNLFFNPAQDTVFFKNMQDGKLYYINVSGG